MRLHDKDQVLTKQIAIVGGGIAGLMCAIAAGKAGYEVILFEAEAGLMLKTSHFPIHLHSGILYPTLSPDETASLFSDSVIFCRDVPDAVVKRPTLIGLHVGDKHDPEYLINIAKNNQKRYEQCVSRDPANCVFGNPKDYYKLYTREDVERIARKKSPAVTNEDRPNEELSLDDWVVPFAKNTNLDLVKFPIILVQEYLMSMDKVRQHVLNSLDSLPNVTVMLNTRATSVKLNNGLVHIEYVTPQGTSAATVNHVLNAAGETAGKIDDSAGMFTPRFREAKQAFRVSLQAARHEYWPETIIMGPRGDSQAMTEVIPLTPGMFQLLCTSFDATLTNNGLGQTIEGSSHPSLSPEIEAAFNGLDKADDMRRLKAVIERVAARHPSFKHAIPISVQRGIVQIPGKNPNNRVGNLKLYNSSYSSALIVKATSAPKQGRAFVEMLQRIGLHPLIEPQIRSNIRNTARL